MSSASATVSKVHVASRRGHNREPGSGDAWFADGKSFSFSRLPEGGLVFYSWRRRAHGGTERFSFRAPQRAAALEAALNA